LQMLRRRLGIQIRPESCQQLLRQPFWLFIMAGTAVKSLCLQNQFPVLVQNAVAEIEPHAFHARHPHFNCQQVIVARGEFVAHARLNDRENIPGLLQGQNRLALRAHEFASRGFEQVQITRMVNMIANRAFGVGHAVDVSERFGHPASVKFRPKSSTRKVLFWPPSILDPRTICAKLGATVSCTTRSRLRICRMSRPMDMPTKAPIPFSATGTLRVISSGVSSRRSASRCWSWPLIGNCTSAPIRRWPWPWSACP
jgi:hypothetical protein